MQIYLKLSQMWGDPLLIMLLATPLGAGAFWLAIYSTGGKILVQLSPPLP